MSSNNSSRRRPYLRRVLEIIWRCDLINWDSQCVTGYNKKTMSSNSLALDERMGKLKSDLLNNSPNKSH